MVKSAKNKFIIMATTKKQTPEKINAEIKVFDCKTCDFFHIVKIKNKYRITVGNNIMSAKEFKDTQGAEAYVREKPYELVINLIALISKQIWNDYELQKKNEAIKTAD